MNNSYLIQSIFQGQLLFIILHIRPAKTIHCNTDQAMRNDGKATWDGRRMQSSNKAAQLPTTIAQPDQKHSDPIYSINDSSLFQGDIFLNPEQRAFLESGINRKCLIEVIY